MTLRMNRGKRFWVSLVVLAILIVVVFYFRQKSFESIRTIQNSFQRVASRPKFIPTPTSYPFENLTIPYLRKQTYKSSLGSLHKVAQNNNYTSYLTSYTSDGFKINGLLTIPVGIPPKDGFPAIVFVHG